MKGSILDLWEEELVLFVKMIILFLDPLENFVPREYPELLRF